MIDAASEASMRGRRYSDRSLNVRLPPRLQAAREVTTSELVRDALRKHLVKMPERQEDSS
jgi:hypothetical protein